VTIEFSCAQVDAVAALLEKRARVKEMTYDTYEFDFLPTIRLRAEALVASGNPLCLHIACTHMRCGAKCLRLTRCVCWEQVSAPTSIRPSSKSRTPVRRSSWTPSARTYERCDRARAAWYTQTQRTYTHTHTRRWPPTK
jgi:hypothetical protein